jgi:hypothetical protein
MTLHRSSPRAKPRWLSLAVMAMALLVITAGLAVAHAGDQVPPPGNYAGGVLEDVDGANDVPGQVDVTQMGRDTSENPDIRIFWSWDSISVWTGSGQTGDACALFDDADADVFIDYVVCARVSNTNADPNLVEILPAAANKPVYLFDCSNKKNDRCTNPAPREYTAGQVLAGPFGQLTQSGAGNLISHTDPFDENDPEGPGTSYPHDSSVDIRIDDALAPSGVRLANVCSYPSAGNGGNNNPFDCIVTPGVQYGTLIITKVLTNDNGGMKDEIDFSFKVNGGTPTPFEADGSNSQTVPVGTYSVIEDGLPITGYTTTYANSVNSNTNCTSLSVTAGGTVTCTITNNDTINQPGIKTAQSYVLYDTANLSNLVTGAPDATTATMTFKLWSTNTAGVCSNQVGSSIVVTGVTSTSIATPTGISVTAAGTYYWTVEYSGDAYNASVTSGCGTESTTIAKTEPTP